MAQKNYDETKLLQELKRDEGIRLDIYKDSLGYNTVGVGHLIIAGDLEFGKPVGTLITNSRCDDLLRKDIANAEKDAARLVDNFDELPDNIQRVLINMTFNLGYTKLMKWVNFRGAINQGNYQQMIASMRNSLWAKQVGDRAKRLIQLVEDQIRINQTQAGQRF